MPSITRRCVSCQCEVHPIYDIEEKPENGMWLNATVGRFTANYGSIFDGDEFVIAVCDACMSELKTRVEWHPKFDTKCVKKQNI